MERARVQSVSKCFLLSFYLSSQFWYKDARTHARAHTHTSLLSVFWLDSLKRHGFWNWRRDRAMQNILCGSRLTQLGRQLKQPHTRTHTNSQMQAQAWNTCWLATAEGHSTSCLSTVQRTEWVSGCEGERQAETLKRGKETVDVTE